MGSGIIVENVVEFKLLVDVVIVGFYLKEDSYWVNEFLWVRIE